MAGWLEFCGISLRLIVAISCLKEKVYYKLNYYKLNYQFSQNNQIINGL